MFCNDSPPQARCQGSNYLMPVDSFQITKIGGKEEKEEKKKRKKKTPILPSGEARKRAAAAATAFWLELASKQQAISFREAYVGRSGSEDDNASGVGYYPPHSFRDLDLGFLVPLPSGFNPGEFRLVGSIGNWFTPPLRGSQGRRGGFLFRGA